MKFVLILALSAILLQVNARPAIQEQWENFKRTNNKLYSPEEEARRLVIFAQNLEIIEAHNERFRNGQETFEQGINALSDKTEEEMSALTAFQFPPVESFASLAAPAPPYTGPANFDWRTKNVIGAVKNQGTCGSCWAFSANAALEAAYRIQKQTIVTLSEQQLVDCTSNALGCKGGWMEQAYDSVRKSGGLEASSDYPYEATNKTCRFNSKLTKATISDYVRLPAGNEKELLNAVGSIGPVAVAIDVGKGFQNYKSGIFYNATCTVNRLTHAVAVVGFGTDNGQDYWLVRNSWGTTWGDAGYVKMARNVNNNCGIATHAVYPII